MYVSEVDQKKLRHSFSNKNITLYLGAGTSIGSGLPNWEKLVLSMYFSTVSQQKMDNMRPYANYLYSISEWYLKSNPEPLEITARKLRTHLKTNHDLEQDFITSLHENLYMNLIDEEGRPKSSITAEFLSTKNSSLSSISKLCKKSSSSTGILSVISYNYDNLLEILIEKNDIPHQVIFRNESYLPDKLPIYHVHGFVPLDKNETRCSDESEIVFTEDQYHIIARDPYNWSNMVQMKYLSGSIGIMIGLSLADRNMRRLLDAIQNSPFETKNFAIIQKPSTQKPADEILEKIHFKAIKYLKDFENLGINESAGENNVLFRKRSVGDKSTNQINEVGQKGVGYKKQIAEIINHVQMVSQKQQEEVLKELGITPIWYSDHDEIPIILTELFGELN